MIFFLILFPIVGGNPFMGGGMMVPGGNSFPFGPQMRPSFLQTANYTVIQEWDAISQGNKTISQQQQDQINFGNKYGLTPQVQQWQQNITQIQNEMSQNLSAIISALGPLKEQFMNILNNKDQTPEAMMQSIWQLKNQSGTNGDALSAVMMIMLKNSHQNGMQTMGGVGTFGNGWNQGGMGSPFSMGGSGFPSVQMPQNPNNPFPMGGGAQPGNFGGFPGQNMGFPQNMGQPQPGQPIMFGPGPMPQGK